MGNVTISKLATNLKLATPGGNPHIELVKAILFELEIDPIKRTSKGFEYGPKVHGQINKWFWDKFGDSLPEKVPAKGRKYYVRYLPEPDESGKSNIA